VSRKQVVFGRRSECGGSRLVFQLVYNGEIRSGQRRGVLDKKHEMRLAFGVYLRRLWRQEKALQRFANGLPRVPYPLRRPAPDDDEQPFYRTESLGGYAWIPLITRRNRMMVHLDIELVGDAPRVLKPSGDIDNRLKVVLDSLRMVRQPSEIGTATTKGCDDLYVLLEDDSLIHNLTVTATPSLGSPVENRVTVDVKIVPNEWDRHPALPFL
jgi:hypothetical protein